MLWQAAEAAKLREKVKSLKDEVKRKDEEIHRKEEEVNKLLKLMRHRRPCSWTSSCMFVPPLSYKFPHRRLAGF